MSTATSAFRDGWLLMAGLIVAIGAQNAFVLRQGLGRSHVAPVVVFCTVSDVALIAAGVFGLGALVAHSPLALDALRYGGAAFLAGYAARAAWRAWRGGMSLAPARADDGIRATLATTAALTWLNPHVWLDTVVLLGAVGAQQAVDDRPSFALGASLASAMWFSTLGFGAAALSPRFQRPGAWRLVDGAVAVAMGALALQLLLQGVNR
jgi:L-lysine exporter family protein LysE/ArgO